MHVDCLLVNFDVLHSLLVLFSFPGVWLELVEFYACILLFDSFFDIDEVVCLDIVLYLVGLFTFI